MGSFSFRDRTIHMDIAGHQFCLIVDNLLGDKMKKHSMGCLEMANMLRKEKMDIAEATGKLCEIIDDILGNGASEQIFSQREATFMDCSDVLEFIKDEIVKSKGAHKPEPAKSR